MVISMGGIESVAQDRNVFCAVNPHFLERIVRLAQEMDVVVRCEIVDEDGTKLLERGALLSRSNQLMLAGRRLRRPLEVSLDLAQGESLAGVVSDCLGLIERIPALALLGGGRAGEETLRALAGRRLDEPLKLLLTLAARLGKGNYENSLAAMIIGSGLAHGLGLSENDSELLVLAALLQDVGESYIDPLLEDGSGALPIEQWRNVAAHPSVGQAFLSAFTSFPPALAEVVLQHHERQDGSGYPDQRTAASMSPLGTLIGLADCVSALVMGGCGAGELARDGDPCSSLAERVAIALSIVSDEFPAAAVAFVTSTLAPLKARGAGISGANFAQRILPTLQQIRFARLAAEKLSRSAATSSLAPIGEIALQAIRILDKRLRATGVYDISQLGVLESDAQRMAQTCLVLDEVKWRLRNLARSIYLRTEQIGAGQALALTGELVAILSAGVTLP